jgi:diketogulonate reductase-like aldo/keto reductase
MTQVQTQPHNPGSHLAPNAVPINNLVAMAAQVDMNGIIAIGVIDFEKKMEDCKVRINAQTDQVKKSIADREKNIQDTCTAAGMAVDIQAENDICAALAAAKFGKYITDAVVLEIDEQHQNIRV